MLAMEKKMKQTELEKSMGMAKTRKERMQKLDEERAKKMPPNDLTLE